MQVGAGKSDWKAYREGNCLSFALSDPFSGALLCPNHVYGLTDEHTHTHIQVLSHEVPMQTGVGGRMQLGQTMSPSFTC